MWSCLRALSASRARCAWKVSLSGLFARALQHRLGGLSDPRLVDLWIGGRAASVALRCLAAPKVVVSSANPALAIAPVLLRQADGWNLLAASSRTELLIELLVRFPPSGIGVARPSSDH